MTLLQEENEMLRQKLFLAEQELRRFNGSPQLEIAFPSDQHTMGQVSFAQDYASTSNYILPSTLYGPEMSPSFVAPLMPAGLPQETNIQPRGQQLNERSSIQFPV